MPLSQIASVPLTLDPCRQLFGSLIRLMERLPESGSRGPACEGTDDEGALIEGELLEPTDGAPEEGPPGKPAEGFVTITPLGP